MSIESSSIICIGGGTNHQLLIPGMYVNHKQLMLFIIIIFILISSFRLFWVFMSLRRK